VYCRHCHYDLSRTANNRCPECGRSFDPKVPETFLPNDSQCFKARHRTRHVCIIRGIVLPLIFAGYGVWCLAAQATFLPGALRLSFWSPLPLHGPPAIAIGIAWLGLGVALAGAFLFGRLEPCWRYAPIAVYAGIGSVVLGWGYAFFWALARVFS
jgi:hypothetical protein